MGTVVWTAATPVPRRTVWIEAVQALVYHYYRAVFIGE